MTVIKTGALIMALVASCSSAVGQTSPAGALTAECQGGRTVFQRMEPDARLSILVRNGFDHPLCEVEVSVFLDGIPAGSAPKQQEMAAGGSVLVEAALDTGLRPATYSLTLRMTGRAGERVVQSEVPSPVKVSIVARPRPHVLPVIFWGNRDAAQLKEMGFTHAESILLRPDYDRIFKGGDAATAAAPAKTARVMAELDKMLLNGIGAIARLDPGAHLMQRPDLKEKLQRRDRGGAPYRRANTCGLHPEAQRFCFDTGAAVAAAYGRHPAFKGANINNELRDASELCFHEHDRATYQRFSGQPIPESASQKAGLSPAESAPHIPASGIVPDDHPILTFYRWFWKEGDGWNALQTQVHRGLEKGTQPDFFTWHDPAVRVPPVWGSGGELDALSHWTYTSPDPLKISLAADELFAMALGRPAQRVMKMTTVLWYRDQTAPNIPQKEEERADWEKKDPDARFITCAPDHLREAFWLKLSRPVQGIMYYGTGVLMGGGTAQRMTNPETREALRELLHNVVEPLGPMLMQVRSAPTDVAMLESFTSMVFGGQATWGWARTWAADAHQTLQWARLQPKVVYEETILRDGLDGVRVLVMPNCRVLPQGVFERVRDFQRRGGIVVGDENLAPALTPDIVLSSHGRKGMPDKDKAALQALAAQLRGELGPAYTWRADSSNSDIILYTRSWQDTDYLFAVNDKRTYGDYVGHHRLVMEKGLANQADILIRRKGVHVYDLTEGRAVETRSTADGTAWTASFGPGAGRIVMICPQAVADVQIAVAPRGDSDRSVSFAVKVADAAGLPVKAVVPISVRILDPGGREAEFSGAYGARDGVQEIRFDLASNDMRGAWTVHAREGATGATAQAAFQYR